MIWRVILFWLLGAGLALADLGRGVWLYQRDYAGRLRQQTDGDNQTVIFNYSPDPLGRLLSRQVYDMRTNFICGVTNIFDSNGGDTRYPVYSCQLHKTIDSEGYAKYGYDVRGRVLKTARYLAKNANTYTSQYLYDDLDRVRQTVYPNGGPTVTNIYDTGANLSKVQQLGGSGTVYYTATGFNALDQLTGINFGNGVSAANTYYTNSHRLHSLVTSKSTNLQSLTYTYDHVSDLLNLSDGVYSGAASASLTNIAYDDLHRVTSLTRPATSQTSTFNYTSIGNIISNSEDGAGAYGYGTRLPHAVKSANGANYSYDQNGNMLTRGGQELVYDPENRLTLVVMSNSTVAFGYDASGARLWKQGAPTNSLQVWIDGIYEEKDGKILYHVLAGDRIVCTFDSTGITTEYYHPDQLHSTAVETDSSGNSYQHYEYSAFGQSRYTLSTTAFPVSRRYTAQVLDEETGLYFYGSRYYDPQLGRFIQPDPIIPDAFNPQSYDRYAYALNNPLRYTDPDGHWGQEVADWWSGVVNRGAGYISASPSHWIWNGTVGTVNSLVGGLAAPLGLGSAAGSVSGNPNATGWQIAGATVQEGANLAALVPAAAGAGKAVSTLVRAGEKEAVGELAGALGGCFLAGTLVPTESGNVEIQTVKAGDRVWSYSMTTAEWELRSVEATPVHDYTGDIITIGVGGAVIEATDNHPFWVVSGDEIASRPLATDVPEDERAFNPSGRWVEARSLRVGDVVLLLGGETATITGLSERQEHLAVYNLRVEVNHTYAVSQAGVLVHNKAAQIKPVPKEGTYEFPDKQAPGKTYVGQSGDLPKRLGTHEKTGRKAPGTEAQTTEVPGGKTQREMQEQRRIDQLGGTRGKPGSQTSNQRNPVSPERQKQLGMKPNEN